MPVMQQQREDGLQMVDWLELPSAALFCIMRSLDRRTRRHTFCSSKLMASLILQACPLNLSHKGDTPKLSASVLTWTSEQSCDLRLKLTAATDTTDQTVEESLNQMMATEPAHFPSLKAVTEMSLSGFTTPAIVTPQLAQLFPNLKSLTLDCAMAAEEQHQTLQVCTDSIAALSLCLPCLHHLSICDTFATTPEQRQAVAQQLLALPSLRSLAVDPVLFLHIPHQVTAKLTRLCLHALQAASPAWPDVSRLPWATEAEREAWRAPVLAQLSQCPRLHSLKLDRVSSVLLMHELPHTLPRLRELCLECHRVNDADMQTLLSLPHLTHLDVSSFDLQGKYDKAACTWQSLAVGTIDVFEAHRPAAANSGTATGTRLRAQLARLPLRVLQHPLHLRFASYHLRDSHEVELQALVSAPWTRQLRGATRIQASCFSIKEWSTSKRSDAQVAQLLATLPDHVHTRSMELEFFCVGAATLACLATHWVDLTYLDLFDCQMDPGFWGALGAAVAHLPDLHTLRFSLQPKLPLTDQQVDALRCLDPPGRVSWEVLVQADGASPVKHEWSAERDEGDAYAALQQLWVGPDADHILNVMLSIRW